MFCYAFLTDAFEFLQHAAEHLFCLLFAGSGVERQRARAGVARRIRVDGVCKSKLLANGLKQPRTHAAADDVGEHRERVLSLAIPRKSGQRQADMYLLDVFFDKLFSFSARKALQNRRCRARGCRDIEPLFHGIDQRLLFKVSRAGDDDVVRHIKLIFIRKQRLARERAHALLGAEDRARQRLIPKEEHVALFA